MTTMEDTTTTTQKQWKILDYEVYFTDLSLFLISYLIRPAFKVATISVFCNSKIGNDLSHKIYIAILA